MKTYLPSLLYNMCMYVCVYMSVCICKYVCVYIYPLRNVFVTFHGASLIAQLVKNLPSVRRAGFDSWVRKIPWRRTWQPTPVILPGEPHGERSLTGYSPWGRKIGHDWASKPQSSHRDVYREILLIPCLFDQQKPSPREAWYRAEPHHTLVSSACLTVYRAEFNYL